MKKTSSVKKSQFIWRIVISIVGAAMILLALRNISLYYFGEQTIASISVSRRGGSSDSSVSSNRYEWSVDYSFMDSDGNPHNGHTTVRGSDTSAGSISSSVYYFPFAPYLNALSKDASPSVGQPILIGLGIFLIFVMNKKKKHPHRAARKSSKPGSPDVP